MSQWKFGKLGAQWQFSSTAFTDTGFVLNSVPATLQRGSSYTLGCSNLEAAPTVELEGHSVTVTDWDETSISITVPVGILASHGGGKELSVESGGTTETATVELGPGVGMLYQVLSEPVGGAGTVWEGMNESGTPVSPATIDEAIFSATAGAYNVLFDEEGFPIVFTLGNELAGETIQLRLLRPGTWITDAATITLDFYVESNQNPVLLSAIPDQAVFAGQAISFDVSGNFADPDGHALIFTKTAGDSGLSINPSTGVITGSITGAAGAYSVTIQADDDIGTPVSDTFIFTVTLDQPQFSFTDVTGHARSTDVQAIADVTEVVNGARLEFSGGGISINGGASFTSTSPVYAVAGQTKARVATISSGSYSTAVQQSMTINGIQRTFTVTTIGAPSITLTATRNTVAETVSLSAELTNHTASSIVFQADTGSGFGNINTDSSAPYAYIYDASALTPGSEVSFRAVDGSLQSNAVTITISAAATSGNGVVRSIASSMSRPMVH